MVIADTLPSAITLSIAICMYGGWAYILPLFHLSLSQLIYLPAVGSILDARGSDLPPALDLRCRRTGYRMKHSVPSAGSSAETIGRCQACRPPGFLWASETWIISRPVAHPPRHPSRSDPVCVSLSQPVPWQMAKRPYSLVPSPSPSTIQTRFADHGFAIPKRKCPFGPVLCVARLPAR
ncbi:hypothetical protein B0I35DRAFT_429040 [Stachybotrys elegans]|uniref:Uncharacterized protein n=1 Tax=Stachybotrys elegans TaxID=80388 RepID=A0A8K0STH1_9HYPO|nr:hypothetical protein B0I35DRAFT_429040 [Stachybotrys elegans]